MIGRIEVSTKRTRYQSSCSSAWARAGSRTTARGRGVRLRPDRMASGRMPTEDSGSLSLSRMSASRIIAALGVRREVLGEAELAARQRLEERLDLADLLGDAHRRVLALAAADLEPRRATLDGSHEIAREVDIDLVLDAEAGDHDRSALRRLVALARPPHVVGDAQVGPAGLATADFVSSQVHRGNPFLRPSSSLLSGLDGCPAAALCRRFWTPVLGDPSCLVPWPSSLRLPHQKGPCAHVSKASVCARPPPAASQIFLTVPTGCCSRSLRWSFLGSTRGQQTPAH